MIKTQTTAIESFENISRGQAQSAGGKARVLAELYQQKLPIPNGFVIFPEVFVGDTLPPSARAEVQMRLAELRSNNAQLRFAVRSSAINEDGQQASFAGEFESVLNVETHEAVYEAIQTVRQSRHHERVQAYSQVHGMAVEHEVAVIIQEMVPATLAGVLFTADPVSGSRTVMVGNFVEGLGERLVSGEANPSAFTLMRPSGKYDGPTELQPFANRLFQLAGQLEQHLDGPQDIEWAIAGNQVYILQARPITTLQAHNERTGEWNDSLLGDYLWSSTNLGEALPDVMTPFTWSVMQVYFRSNRLGIETDQMPLGGNIGGRLYINLSLFMSGTKAIGLSQEKALRMAAETFGHISDDITVPLVPMSRWAVLREFIPNAWRRLRLIGNLKKRIPAFVAAAPARVAHLETAIAAAQTSAALLDLWQRALESALDETCLMLAAGTSDYKNLSRQLHVELEKLVREDDVNALMSGLSTEADYLASLGPVIGLVKVNQGEMSREAYLQHYGHRGPHELELSLPRPSEDPAWLDRQLIEAADNPVDAAALLSRQQQAHAAAWQRFIKQYPGQAHSVRRRLDRMAAAAHSREAVRSEVVRLFGVFRCFALRAGELTSLGDDIFFLSLPEVLALLVGDKTAVASIPARKETHARYAALPPYPPLISGRFEPQHWAADPQRRTDRFDAHQPASPPTEGMIKGFAGAAGVVEGRVRRLTSLEEGAQLQPGEILVTVTTNVGWTPLFPRAAAIITDVGAPLSHAAIVARELGIPAVVGCGDATMRLETGDLVRVDGGHGTVEVLKP